MRALALLIALAATPAAAQNVVTSPAPEGVAVTVYRDPGRGASEPLDLDMLSGFALVSERRRVRLPAGEAVVRFEGVAAGIVPQSAIVTGFPGGVVERNRDAYLLSPATLLDRSLGRRVSLRRTSRATGQVREQEAEIMSSAAGALVIRTADGFEALRCTGLPETVVYEEMPPGLSSRPTLSVRTRSAAPVDAVVTLSYLATGFDWQANYVAHLSDDGRRMDLFAWLTLASTDQTSFPNAQAQAVAGQLNYTRAEAEPAEGPPLNLQCWAQGSTSNVPLEQWQNAPPPPPALTVYASDGESIVVTGRRIRNPNLESSAPVSVVMAEQEELGDLKLYRIPEPVTVAANAQKQVALLHRRAVRVETVYRARISAADRNRDFVWAYRTLVTRNREREGLGLPLPAGGVALFQRHGGRPILTGQGSLADLAIGEDVEIGLEESRSVFARVLTEPERPGEREDARLVVTNDQARPVVFEAEFDVPSDSTFAPIRRLATRDARPLWRVTVPANGTVTLRYRLGKRSR